MRTALLSLVAVSLATAACGGSRYGHTGAMSPPHESAAYAAEPAPSTEQYTDHGVSPFVDASKDKLSTFAIDVDTASWSISRRKLREG